MKARVEVQSTFEKALKTFWVVSSGYKGDSLSLETRGDLIPYNAWGSPHTRKNYPD